MRHHHYVAQPDPADDHKHMTGCDRLWVSKSSREDMIRAAMAEQSLTRSEAIRQVDHVVEVYPYMHMN